MGVEFIVDAALGKNPKFRDLSKRLAGPANAVWALHRLWAFAALYRKNGDLTGIDAAEVPLSAVEWKALVDARFLEVTGDATVIHDWRQYNLGGEEAIERSRRRARRAMARLDAPKNGTLIELEEGTEVARPDVLEQYLDDGFKWFYRFYPKKEGKVPARKAWGQLHRKLLTLGERRGITKAVKERMVAHIGRKLETGEWRPDQEHRRFIPDPAVYLNQRRWED